MNTAVRLLAILCALNCFAQQYDSQLVLNFQKEMNISFADPKSSPLPKKDLAKFKGLAYYAPNPKYFVVAKFVRTEYEKPFEMPTSTTRKAMYVKYGTATFMLDGKSHTLNLYQSADPLRDKKYTNLFLPFTDLTSGRETYGGGRYIDVKVPQGRMVVIDFNQAYNPYCAYSHDYSCPVPPRENHLKTAIRAGVKSYKH